MKAGKVWLGMAAACFSLSVAHVAGAQAPEAGAQDPGSMQEIPSSMHQRQAVEQVPDSFDALDKDGDELLSYEEAQESSALAGYWREQGLDEDATMDRADFAQFEALVETGTEDSPSVPSSEHQREAVEDVPSAAETPEQ